VKALRRKNIVCAMVGDGANDCPAIKAADLGISFAETDASISAPFSSMNPSISCVERIIMEGKCTTQNSIEALRYYATTGLYKFVACGIMIFTNSWYSETQLTFMSYYLGTIIFNVFFGLNAPM
jgi:cation-transporting ATPase 13A3/4/5